MKKYSSNITLTKTSRGVWGLDAVKGCKYGSKIAENGCYNACYACSVSKRYGYDFSDSTIRRFKSKRHLDNIICEIKHIDSDYIRIGVMGDPSECWGHTVDVCDKISSSNKHIVIITKHWEEIPEYLYDKIKSLDLTINTSISALDNDLLLRYRLYQYNKLKKICNSVLRIVSCDFNKNNIYGIMCSEIQQELFKNKNTIDTILRVNKDHYLVKNLIINVGEKDFLRSKTCASINNSSTHFGYCESCNDKCGVRFKK